MARREPSVFRTGPLAVPLRKRDGGRYPPARRVPHLPVDHPELEWLALEFDRDPLGVRDESRAIAAESDEIGRVTPGAGKSSSPPDGIAASSSSTRSRGGPGFRPSPARADGSPRGDGPLPRRPGPAPCRRRRACGGGCRARPRPRCAWRSPGRAGRRRPARPARQRAGPPWRSVRRVRPARPARRSAPCRASRAAATIPVVVRATLCRRASLPEPIPRRRGPRLDRLLGQEPAHVGREAAGRLVATAAVLLQRLHDDPVEIPLHQGRQLGRLGLPLRRDLRAASRPACSAGCSAGAAPLP